MRLLSLTLDSFRNYPHLELCFVEKEKLFVLVGENATGKTNALEAITILSLLKSPRKVEESDLITWEQTAYRIQGEVLSDSGEKKQLEVVSQVSPRRQRACFINGVRTPSQQYLGIFPVITFAPEDLDLFTGSPALRRRFIDDLLTQVSPAYRQALSEYEKTLKQRNALLRQIQEGIQKSSTLDIWDEKLSLSGAIITVERLQLFETLQMTLLRELHALGEKPTLASFTYMRKGEALEERKIQKEIVDMLRTNRERDIVIEMTTVGPHRDDFSLSFDRRDITTFASRGQQRAALLALLLLEASFLEMRTGEKPVLLLDDVFSEFDEKHRQAVLKAFTGNQVIVTATHVEKNFKEKAKLIVCPME
jgi:DNA replication and repair protein RecF